MLDRSVIITDTNGIIIGAPAKERLGTFHPPSVLCVKYKKMSYDDEAAARKLGVWYPGTTVPLFFDGRVIGTAAVAGDPEVVLQFSTLVKKQIESIIKEKVFGPYATQSQRSITELVREISQFDPVKNSGAALPEMAARLGINLALPRIPAAIFLSNFHGLSLSKNPIRLTYKSSSDPISDEIDYNTMRDRIVQIIREVLPDPQNIVAAVARDRFAVLRLIEENALDTDSILAKTKELCADIFTKLQEAAIDTIIGIGDPAAGLFELPSAYANSWSVVAAIETEEIKPGIYCFSDMPLRQMLRHLGANPTLAYLERKLQASVQENGDSEELLLTFCRYCECFCSKQETAAALHIHRNTLTYRLAKIEDKFNISLNNFEQVVSLYLTAAKQKLEKDTFKGDSFAWRNR